MTALVSVLMITIMNMFVDVLLALMIVCMFMLIIGMATHLDSPPTYYSTTQSRNLDYMILSMNIFEEIVNLLFRK